MPQKINEIGNVYGELTVVSEAPPKGKITRWNCQCFCGNKTVVRGSSLRNGHTKSCGCLNRKIVSKLNRKNEIGNKYGRLTVISPAGFSKNRNIVWVCRCSCGNEIVVRGDMLRNGDTKSCGCLLRDLLSTRTGIKHPNFKSGQHIDYGKKSQIDFHDHIRKRDNYTCQMCGRSQKDELRDINQKLAVHHLDDDHFNNTDDNAITLCLSCHRKITDADKRQREEQEALEISIKIAEGN